MKRWQNVFFAVGLLFLGITLWKVGWDQITRGFAELGLWFVPVAAVNLAWYAADAFGWGSVLGTPGRFPGRANRLVWAQVAGEAFSNATPTMNLGGEPIKGLLLRDRVPGDLVVSSLVVDNTIKYIATALYLAVGLGLGLALIDLEVDWAIRAAMVGVVAVLAAAVGAAWAAQSRGLLSRLLDLGRRVGLGEARVAGLRPAAERIDRAIGQFWATRRRDFLASLGWHLASRVIMTVDVWVLLHLLGQPVDLLTALFIQTVNVLINLGLGMVPLQIGFAEGGNWILFPLLGMPADTGMVFSLVRRVRGLVWMALGLGLVQGMAPGGAREAWPWRRTAWWLGLAAVLAAAASVQWASQSVLGPVNDELANFPSGVALIRTGEQADPTHPPLARYLMAVPLLAAGVDAHADSPDLGTRWHPYGRAFLFDNVMPWRDVLDLARLPILLLCAGLVAMAALEARRRWGGAAGLFTAAVLAFEPTILGHGTLATTDLALTFAVLAATLAFDRYLRAPSGPRLLAVAALVTAALLTKFAGVLLVPILAVAWVARRLAVGPRPAAMPRVGLRWWAAAAALSVLLVWGAYGFEVRTLAQDRQIAALREAKAVQDGIAKAADRLGLSPDELVNLPIPGYSFLKGFGAQMFHAAKQDAWEDRDFYQYVDGMYDRTGFRTYYLRTFLYKSTLPSLALWLAVAAAGAAAAWAAWRRRDGTAADGSEKWSLSPFSGGEGPAWPLLAVPPVLWVAACSMQTINIGHRYVLPALPFLALGAGWLAGRAWDAALASRADGSLPAGRRARIALAAAAATALVAAHVGTGIAAAPDHVAFFNAIAGGVDHGGEHLADSNIDWGQDLPRLDADARAHCKDGRRCLAAVFGAARPEDYGTPVTAWTEGVDPSALPGATTFYVSENRFLLRSIAHPDGLFPFLAGRVPTRRVGASIRVYEF